MAETLVKEAPEEIIQSDESPQQLNDGPDDPPTKLSVKDFAAKVKAKYPEYKDMDDTELTNKIIAKHPEYKDQVDFGEVKKKSSGIVLSPSSSAIPSNSEAPSPSQDIIPLVDIHKGEPVDNSVDGNMPGNENDIVANALYAKQLRGKKIESGADAETGGDYLKDDPEAIKAADELAAKIKTAGYDADKIANDFDGIPESVYKVPTFSKGQLLADYKDNPVLYNRKIATIKGQTELQHQLNKVDGGKELFQEVLKAYDNHDVGDFSQQRQNIQRVIGIANQYGGDKKDEIIRNLGIDWSNNYAKAASDPEQLKNDPLYLNPSINANQLAAYRWMQDTDPKSARRYEAAFLDNNQIKGDTEAQLAKQEAGKRLDEAGIAMQRNYANEHTAPLLKEYKALFDKADKTPEDEQRMQELAVQGEPYNKILDAVSADEGNLNANYPKSARLDAGNFAQELLGQKHTGLDWLAAKTGVATDNTFQGLADIVKAPFESENQNQINRAEVLGNDALNQNSAYLKQGNQTTQTFTPTVGKELQADIDAIKGDKLLNDKQKREQVTDLLVKRAGEWSRTPIDGGRTNLSLSSLMYGAGGIAADLAPFIATEALTGGGASGSGLKKFTSTFTSAFATGFHDSYLQALKEGDPNPYAKAMRVTAINSAALAGADAPGAIRKMFGENPEVSRLLSKMSDDEIAATLKQEPKAIGTFRKALAAVKKGGSAVTDAAAQGFKGATKVTAFQTAGQVANDVISGDLKAPADYGKEFLLNTLKFGLFGTALGVIGKTTTKPTDLGLAALSKFGENPESGLAALADMEKKGSISTEDAEKIRGNIEQAAKVFKTSPVLNNPDISDNVKREYLYNEMVKNKSSDAAKNLPPEQAAKAEKTSLVAEKKNELLLSSPTDNQLSKMKDDLEKSLVPETDASGKAKEIPDKVKKETEAHLQAVNDIIDERSASVADKVAKEKLVSKGTNGVGQDGTDGNKKITSDIINPHTSEFKLEPSNVISDSKSDKFIVNKDGKEVAQLSLDTNEDGNVKISFISVDKNYRRQGIAGRIYKEINNAISENKMGTLHSDDVFLGDEEAKGIWEKLIKDGVAEKLDDGRYKFKDNKNSIDIEITKDEAQKQFPDTKVVDEKGAPLKVYHGSLADFDKFDNDKAFSGNIGFHFGTPEAAESRIKTLTESGDKKIGDSWNLMSGYLDIKNPLEVEDSFGREDSVIEAIIGSDSKIKKADLDLLKKEQYKEQSDPKALQKLILDVLKRNGYDGLVYDNSLEGKGEKSYVIFDGKQFIPDKKSKIPFQDGKENKIPDTQKTGSITEEGTDSKSGAAEESEGEKIGVHHAALTDLSEKLGWKKPEPGEWFTKEEYADRGRKLMGAGADASEVDNTANELHDRISIGRAHMEQLNKELNEIRKEKGSDSPEYKAKDEEFNKLAGKVKGLGNKAGQAMMSLQGERDIDTDNFVSVKRALEEKQDKPASSAQEKKIAELTANNEALVNHAIAAEKKLIEETEKAFNEGVEEGKKQKSEAKKSTSEKAKDIASKIREAKVHRPGSFSAATPASLVWDSAVEVVAKTVEAGGSIVSAIQKGITHIRESDWFKNLTEDKQEQAEKDFYDWHNEQTGLTDLQNMFLNKNPKDLKFTPEEAKAVWDFGKSVYLDGGSSFREMIKNVANDTGLSYRQVSEAITTKKTQEISNEMWAAQSDLKKGRKATENWIEQQGKNKIVRGFKTVMGVFRGISVFGHGAIFVGTHAGATLFDPKLSRSTQRAFVNGWKFAYGKTANYELAMEEFKDRPNYLLAQRAGLKNNPERINVEEFQRSQDFLRKIRLGKVATAGERGFNAIKVLRQDIFDYEYNKLSSEEKADPASAVRVAELANNATGATNLKVPEVVNEVTFAGGMEASRWARLITNPLKASATAGETILNKISGKKTVTPSEAVFAKVWARRVGQQVATYAGALVANYGLQLLLNPKNPVNITNPNKPDFLKFKFGDETIDPTSGVRSAAAFMYGLGKIPFESKKELHGDSPGQSFSKSVGGYVRGKLAPGYGTVADFLSSHDYGGNTMPYSNEKPGSGKHKLTWGEYLWSKSPLPAAEAAQTIYQSARENGANESVLQRVLWGMATGALSGGTGFRVGESEPKKEPFDDKDKADPTFKFYIDKGLDLPNTAHTSEKITNEKAGTKKTLADYPKEIQDQYDILHKQYLKQELDNMKGIVFVKTYKDGQGADVVEVYKKKPEKGTSVRKNISDLSKDELAQVLSTAQSKATELTKKKIFGKN